MVKKTRTAPSGQKRKPRRETLELLSDNIRVLRVQQRYSQEVLAQEAGIHRTYVGDLERCEQNPTLATLEALADALDVRIADLLLPVEKRSRKRAP